MTDAPPTPNPAEQPDDDAPNPRETTAAIPAARQPATPSGVVPSQANRNLWIAVGVLTLLFFISILLRPGPGGTSPAPAEHDPDIAATRAEIEARRAELNRQRAEMNLPPLATRGEALEDITARMRKDGDTLISLIERSQQLLVEKDRLLTEKNVELIRSEQLREALSTELARAQVTNADATRMSDEVAAALARANALADELAAARRQIEELSANPPTDELDVMKRRLDEATRARDFFEQRAAELETRLRQQLDPPTPEDEGDEEFPEEP